jgi:hypothetical protein
MVVAVIEIALFLLMVELLGRPVGDAQPSQLAFLVTLALLLFATKLSGAVFAVMCVAIALPWLVDGLRRYPLALGGTLVLAATSFGVHVARSYVASGVPLYPATVLADWSLPWSMQRADVVEEMSYILSWARLPSYKPAEVLANWNWLGPWLENFPRWGWYTLGAALVFTLTHLVLVWLAPSRSPDRRFYLLYAPLWIWMIGWFFISPDRRFLGAIPELTGGLAGFLAIRQLSDNGHSRGLAGLLTLQLPAWGGAIALAIAALIALKSAPLAWHGWQPIPSPAIETRSTTSGLVVNVPKTGSQCWDAPLPCEGFFIRRLRLLGPDLVSGFTRKPP